MGEKSKKSIQFFLNKEQMANARAVINALKKAGKIDEDVSEGRVAKAVFLAFIDDMMGKGEKEE